VKLKNKEIIDLNTFDIDMESELSNPMEVTYKKLNQFTLKSYNFQRIIQNY
jgi:hypothetical protein